MCQSFSASLWCTQQSVDSLKSAHTSFHRALAPQSQGLEDVIRTVRRLDPQIIHSRELKRGEIVGEGGTFWVEHCSFEGTAVAVKRLKVESRETESKEFLRRVDSLLLELQIMHHDPLRSHPNILNLMGCGWDTDRGAVLPYMVVEYSGYGTLREYLRGRHKTTLLDQEMFIADVAAGIHALHTTGVIHGDIKLDNVLVFYSNERSNCPIAKIADFGHSILEGKDEDTEKTGIYTGTTRYVLHEHR